MATKKAQPDTKAPDAQNAPIARNKKAHFKYELLERFEAGLVLTGSEIKSVRNRKVSLDQAFGRVRNAEIFLVGMNIAQYEQGGYANHDPLRQRKILLHKREIRRIIQVLAQGAMTLVPVSVYLKRGLAKVQMAIARAKRAPDKREAMKKRESDREIRRVVRGRGGRPG